MMLNTDRWEYFNLGKLFDITAGIYHYSDEYDVGKTPYISASNENNGIQQRIDLEPEFEGNCIIAGKVGCTTFYQEEPFCATSDVNIFTPKNFVLNREIGLFITTIINFSENYKWNYGRQCRIGDSKKINIKLPVKQLDGKYIIDSTKTFSDDGFIPDFDFINEFMEHVETIEKGCSGSIKDSLKTNNNFQDSQGNLDVINWGNFRLGDIFDLKKGKRLTSENQIEGTIPYIGAIDSNNGVANYIGQSAIHDGNTISLSYNGSVGEAFYQPEPFWATDDVNVLYFKTTNSYTFNKYIALFICTILRQEKYRYSYGRKWILENMISTIIKLPITEDMKPDWQYMESYIQELPYGDRI